MTARSALMQGGVRAILVGARAKVSLSLPSIRGRRGYLCTDRAALQDQASLYGGRQHSNFTVQAQRCERAGEVLMGMCLMDTRLTGYVAPWRFIQHYETWA
jgi:hypothetical protein